MNYGGMSAGHTLRMLENVPGLKLVFDTGNPPLTRDFSKPFPYPMQKTWEFYEKVKDHIAYVHIKDTKWEAAKNEELYFFPGEGDGEVERVLADLFRRGWDGGLSIEPHMAVVFPRRERHVFGAGPLRQLRRVRPARHEDARAPRQADQGLGPGRLRRPGRCRHFTTGNSTVLM